MKDARRIFILTLSFGSGHVRAARAIETEIRGSAPRTELRLLDALAICRPLFLVFYVWPYWMMVRYAPRLWKRFFEARVARKSEQTAPAWAFKYGCRRVFEEIARFQPDTIVAVEVAACEMAVIAQRSGLSTARIIAVITDHEAEPVWVKPEVDLYVVADERVRKQISAWGAPGGKIAVLGIPTDAGFGIAHAADSTRARYGIHDGLPIVLLMGGGQGPTRMDRIAGRLCRSRVPMHVVAIAGRDARVEKRLRRIRARDRARLHVLGWTDNVASLMQAASLLVTKPGGLTLAEAARCALPVIMYDGIPGPETLNAERFASMGAGVVTHDVDETASAVENLLLDKQWLAAMAQRAKRLARPDAATAIASLALNDGEATASLARQRMTA
jgi:processive 1,2-diacylglycerol beta-glucosyltransferase